MSQSWRRVRGFWRGFGVSVTNIRLARSGGTWKAALRNWKLRTKYLHADAKRLSADGCAKRNPNSWICAVWLNQQNERNRKLHFLDSKPLILLRATKFWNIHSFQNCRDFNPNSVCVCSLKTSRVTTSPPGGTWSNNINFCAKVLVDSTWSHLHFLLTMRAGSNPGFQLNVRVLFSPRLSQCHTIIKSSHQRQGHVTSPDVTLPADTTCRYQFQVKFRS